MINSIFGLILLTIRSCLDRIMLRSYVATCIFFSSSHHSVELNTKFISRLSGLKWHFISSSTVFRESWFFSKIFWKCSVQHLDSVTSVILVFNKFAIVHIKYSQWEVDQTISIYFEWKKYILRKLYCKFSLNANDTQYYSWYPF